MGHYDKEFGEIDKKNADERKKAAAELLKNMKKELIGDAKELIESSDIHDIELLNEMINHFREMKIFFEVIKRTSKI